MTGVWVHETNKISGYKIFQTLSLFITMPPKADYWKHFLVQHGLALAFCQIEGCVKPNVSLRTAPTNAVKKRMIFELLIAFSCTNRSSHWSPRQASWRSLERLLWSKKPNQCCRGGDQRRSGQPAKWRKPRSDSMMWGQAKGIFLFSRRWAFVAFLLSLFNAFHCTGVAWHTWASLLLAWLWPKGRGDAQGDNWK